MFASGKTAAVASAANYIEDVFSTYLYTGNNTTQTITNGIDVSTKGGLVWIKDRTTAANNYLFDTERGATSRLFSNLTNAAATSSSTTYFQSFNNNGFTVGYANSDSASNYASWTFRKQPKFFDVVTYTGDGQNGRQISHNLGSTPGCIIVKCLNFTGSGGPSNWLVYHQSVGTTKNLYLNTTAAAFTSNDEFGTPTSTYFVVNQPGGGDTLNANGDQYVAYLFAHNAGGFGLTGTDNVISCGSYTGNGSTNGPTVTLGYEPQWLMIKNASASGSWQIIDNMRGMCVGTSDQRLIANLATVEFTNDYLSPTATGFNLVSDSGEVNGNGNTMIYIAIRRGPMKVPTSGTSVFSPAAETPSGSANYVMNGSSGFPVDMLLYKARNNVATPYLTNRLTNNYLQTASTAAEASYTYGYDLMQGVRGQFDATSQVDYAFRRAPSFFDEVCYTGTGTATTVAHNLGVVPELMIVKTRSLTGQDWAVYSATLGNTGLIYLNQAAAANTGYGHWNSTSPTSTVFSLGGGGYNMVNGSGATYVNYLFATCAGVSKVGSYTGNGTTQTINCGFTGGARFVLIKRTDSTGDWYTYDTARGMTTLTDPYLLLNSTAAESATLGSVTTVSTGFAVNASILAAINTNGASYIFLAIA